MKSTLLSHLPGFGSADPSVLLNISENIDDGGMLCLEYSSSHGQGVIGSTFLQAALERNRSRNNRWIDGPEQLILG